MIGGKDIVILARPTAALKDFILRYVESRWRRCSLEKDPSGEWFIYRDSKARRSWDDWGGIDENQDTMLHFIFGVDGFTVVVSHLPGSETAKMVAELEQNIRANFHTFEITG